MNYAVMIGIGVLTGILSGIFGIGGGIILVPLLVFLLGFQQSTASGISLVALLLPVGILGAYEYYRSGRLTVEHMRFGLIVAVGIFFGAFFGAKIAGWLPEVVLRRSLAILMAGVAVKVWLSTL